MDKAALIKSLNPLIERVRTDRIARGKDGWTRLALTGERLSQHLNGGPYYGVGLIKPGESVTLAAALDLDSHKGETPWPDMVDAALRIISVLERAGLAPIPFRSSGGKGIHIWILWEEPQDAFSVRTFLFDCLARAGFREGSAGVAAGAVEIFPKQSHVPADGQGNYILLPLAGESEPLEPLLNLEPAPRDLITWPMSAPVPVVERTERRQVRASGNVSALRPALEHLAERIAAGEAPNDYDHWVRILMAIHAESGGSDEGLALAHEFSSRIPDYDPDQIDYKWPRFKLDRGVTGATVLALARQQGWVEDVSQHFDVVPADAGELDLPPFDRDKHGSILATGPNLQLACARPDVLGVYLGFDEFRGEMMLAQRPGEWVAFRDENYFQLRCGLERRGFKPISAELFKEAVRAAAAENPFDSAILWLEGLTWDGTRRIGNFFADYWGAEDNAYTRAVSLYAWTALAGRVLSPGCQADMVPVLISGQGERKTSAIKAMAMPGTLSEIDLNNIGKSDDISRLLRGCLIGHINELRGLHTKDLEGIKSFVTRRVEKWVPKYREHTVEFPRRCLFIGDTNETELLDDPTGNRRWLPMHVQGARADEIETLREQFWAEARDLYKESGVMWEAAETLARDVHNEFQVHDVWEEPIRRWLYTDDGIDGQPIERERITVDEVLRHALHFESQRMGKFEEKRVGKILRTLGYERRTSNGKRFWIFAGHLKEP